MVTMRDTLSVVIVVVVALHAHTQIEKHTEKDRILCKMVPSSAQKVTTLVVSGKNNHRNRIRNIKVQLGRFLLGLV